jgi:hypothetical protein
MGFPSPGALSGAWPLIRATDPGKIQGLANAWLHSQFTWPAADRAIFGSTADCGCNRQRPDEHRLWIGVERAHTNREVLQCKGKLCPAGNGVDDRVSAGIVALACDRLQIAAAGGAAGQWGK